MIVWLVVECVSRFDSGMMCLSFLMIFLIFMIVMCVLGIVVDRWLLFLFLMSYSVFVLVVVKFMFDRLMLVLVNVWCSVCWLVWISLLMFFV